MFILAQCLVIYYIITINIRIYFWSRIDATFNYDILSEKLDGPAVSTLQHTIVEVKQRCSVIGTVTKNLS
jgi:hypothetical protein